MPTPHRTTWVQNQADSGTAFGHSPLWHNDSRICETWHAYCLVPCTDIRCNDLDLLRPLLHPLNTRIASSHQE